MDIGHAVRKSNCGPGNVEIKKAIMNEERADD